MKLDEYLRHTAPGVLKKLLDGGFKFKAIHPSILLNVFYVEETPETAEAPETGVIQFLVDSGFRKRIVNGNSAISHQYENGTYNVLIVKDIPFFEKFHELAISRESMIRNLTALLDILELTYQFKLETS